MTIRQCIRAIALGAAAMVVAGCTAAYFGAVNLGGEPEGVTHESLVYDAAHALSLDLYRPADPAAAPVVVFFYGGRWRTGSREDYAFVGRALARRGVIVVVADYRRFPQVVFPGFVEDAARATAFALTHARDWGGDPRRVFVAGHSSGAHLAALVATDARYLAAHDFAPRDLAGAIGIAGPYDFLPLTDPKLREVFGDRLRWPATQPVNFVDGDEPPFLLLQGDDDKSVWVRNSTSLDAKLRAAGVPVTFTLYEGVGHVAIVSAFRLPRLAPTLRDTLAFIAATPPAPTTSEKKTAP